MKISTLAPLLDQWNDRWFKAIEQRLNLQWLAAGKVSKDDVLPVHAVRFARIGDERCYCGSFNDDELFPDEIRHDRSGHSVAVGAVLDEKSAADADLPVFIAVGINYWQFGTNLDAWRAASWRDTRMRQRLNGAMDLLVERCSWSRIEPKEYHLVAVNFFPWVTRAPWSDLPNGLTEAMALHCWGLPNAPERIAELVNTITPAPIVAFHGVNNAVPVLGLRTLQSVTSKPPVVFIDNLGYSSPAKNVATLRTHVLRRHVKRVEDE